MIPSPCHYLERLSAALGAEIHVKRDDLFTFLGSGGNKERKIRGFLPEILEGNHDVVVTTGGLQSNHARVTALFAASHGLACRLVLHGDPAELTRPTANLLVMSLAGASIHVVSPEEIRLALSEAVTEYEMDGFRPYQIPGGGHGLVGALEYVNAVDELAEQVDDSPFDAIILASGTGTTQAGIVAGLERRGWPTRVIGVSVARKRQRGRQITAESYAQIREHLELHGNPRPIEFRDEWVGEGYGKAGPAVFDTIRRACRLDGLVLDPTYTGKAMHALEHYLSSGELARGSRVLFWHTGGLMNLVAASEDFVSPRSVRS